MSRAALVAVGAVAATIACGGKAEDRRGTGDGDISGTGGTPDGPSYRPETDVDFAGDGRFIEGGSVEGGHGSGFDTCYADPGLSVEEGVAAEGDQFLAFRSIDVRPINPDMTDAQVAFFTEDEPLLAGTALYVYFEIRNLSDVAPVGELSLAPVNRCELYQSAIAVPLVALEPGPEWETRCIEIVPEQEQTWLGLWVTGEEFAIGIDAVRLGPPCS